MWTAIWIVGFVVFCTALAKLTQLHKLVVAHAKQWIQFSADLIVELEEPGRSELQDRARDLFYQQLDELERVRRWPLGPKRKTPDET